MTHLKHASPIRRAAQMKRTAMVEIYSEESAANDPLTFREIEESANAEARAIVAQPMFSESQLIAADLAEPSAMVKAARDDERALQQQMDAAARRDWRATP